MVHINNTFLQKTPSKSQKMERVPEKRTKNAAVSEKLGKRNNTAFGILGFPNAEKVIRQKNVHERSSAVLKCSLCLVEILSLPLLTK